jgi:hypothetical protein
MGAVRERKDVLTAVKNRIEELKRIYFANDDEEAEKVAGKRKGRPTDELREELEEDEEIEGEDEEIEGEEVEGEGEEVEGDELEEIEGDELGSIEDIVGEGYLESDEDEGDEEVEEEGEGAEEKKEEAKKATVSGEEKKEAADNKEEMEEPENEEEMVDEDVELESDEDNDNQGFVNIDDIDTFKKPKKERIKDAMKLQVKEKHGHRKKEKRGSTTNTQKLKNKPYMMVQPKKKNEELRAKYKSVKERIRDLQKKSSKIRKGKLKVHRKIYVKS